MQCEAIVRAVRWDPMKQLVLVLVKDKGTGEKEELEGVCLGDAECQINAIRNQQLFKFIINTILCVFLKVSHMKIMQPAWPWRPGWRSWRRPGWSSCRGPSRRRRTIFYLFFENFPSVRITKSEISPGCGTIHQH